MEIPSLDLGDKNLNGKTIPITDTLLNNLSRVSHHLNYFTTGALTIPKDKGTMQGF